MIKFLKNAWNQTKAVAGIVINKVRNLIKKPAASAAVAAPMVIVAGSAHAAVPASVTDAITTAVTDVGVIGAAVLGVIIAIMAFRWLRKAF